MKNITSKAALLVAALMIASLTAASAGDAKETYDKSCAKCHGAEGKGDTKMGQKLEVKDFSDAKVQAELTDEAAFKAIKEGVKGENDKTLMKATEGLSDDEIKALVTHVRSFKK